MGITLREHDRALWQYGVELASRGQQGERERHSRAEGDIVEMLEKEPSGRREPAGGAVR